jgi:magnesium-transporting ATPase (P-type)
MATEKHSAEDAKALGESDNPTSNGANGSVIKSNGSKSHMDQVRTRAYEIFQERKGGSEIGDWQKAEASVSADDTRIADESHTLKADTSRAHSSIADPAHAGVSKSDESKSGAPTIADTSREANGPEADASKGVKVPTDTGTIQEALTKFNSSNEHGLTEEEAASRLKKDGPNAIEEKHISPAQAVLEIPLGTYRMDD